MADEEGEGGQGRQGPATGRPGQGRASQGRRQEGQGRGRQPWTTTPKAREGTPRLQAYYEETVRGRLAQGVRARPTRTRCRGWRRSCSTSAWATRARTRSSSRRPSRSWRRSPARSRSITRAKKAIANFGLRAGMPVGALGDAARRADVRVPGPVHHAGGAADPRLPRAADPELRRPGELHVRHQGADDLPRDRLRQGREDPRDGHHDRDVHRRRDDLAMALLRELGWPFRGETPQQVA